jgi:hypothetical protein
LDDRVWACADADVLRIMEDRRPHQMKSFRWLLHRPTQPAFMDSGRLAAAAGSPRRTAIPASRTAKNRPAGKAIS